MQRVATPLIVSLGSGSSAQRLVRKDLLRPGGYDEHWVQTLIHEHPSVLPVDTIEPAFWPLSPVCMELPLRSGYLDNLFITPAGDIIAVECKLWRNMQARREVIAQLFEYAKDLQARDYIELETAVRKARKEPALSLYGLASGDDPEPQLTEAAFVDAVSRNLRRGRFLLLIVGDGVTENLESLTEFLQQHAGMHFALAVVQLALYSRAGADGQVFVVPSVPLQTVSITRAIVEIGETQEGTFKIVAAPRTATSSQATTLTEEQMFAELDRLGPGTSNRLVSFLKSLEDLQVSWDVKRTLIVRMTVGPHQINPFAITKEGRVDTGYLSWFGSKAQIRPYADRLSSAIPGSVTQDTPKTVLVKRSDGRMFSVTELLDHAAECRAAFEVLNKILADIELSSA